MEKWYRTKCMIKREKKMDPDAEHYSGIVGEKFAFKQRIVVFRPVAKLKAPATTFSLLFLRDSIESWIYNAHSTL